MSVSINEMTSHNGRHIKEDGTNYNFADFNEMTMGGRGCAVIVDTAKTDAKADYSFVAIHCLTSTIMSAYTTRAYAPITPLNSLVGVTLPAGTVLYGQFTSITLTSGNVIAYYGVNNAGA
jgi:hypothetical protein